MIRVIIIDDELPGVNTLKVLIERLELDVAVVATATDPEKGLQLIQSYKPDVVFLDINMPKLSGFELLEKVDEKNFKFVFTTAHREHAVKAIKTKAFDYLLKPIDAEELRICLLNIMEEMKKGQTMPQRRSILELPVNDGILLIKQNNIVRLEASGSYTFIYLKDGAKHTASKNLKYFEVLLDPVLFFRCHQSHVINLNEVSKLQSSDGYSALMSDNSMADVGRNYKDLLLQKLKSI